MKIFAIFLLCLLAAKASGFWESDRKCGEKLTQIMWVVCGNNFNSLIEKRSESSAYEVDIPYPYASSSLANIFKMEPGNLLTKARRMRMIGIAEECCKKSCTLNELTTYCN